MSGPPQVDSPAANRREREKLRQRSQMLDAARDLFSEKGFHNVSMHEIAARAEFSIGTLYSFFKNKEDLYKEMMLDLADAFERGLDEALGSCRDEMDCLRAFIESKGRVFQDNVRIVRLYFAEMLGASYNLQSDLRGELMERYRLRIEKLERLFASGIEKGAFQRVDPHYLAIALDTLSTAFLILWLDDPQLHPYPESSEIIARIFFEKVRTA